MALAAGPGSAYAVVSTGAREKPFRLVRSDGSRATSLGAFGVPGADYADVAAGAAGPLTVVARPTTSGYAYESAGLGAAEVLGAGTGAPVLAARRHDPDRRLPGRRRRRRALARRRRDDAHAHRPGAPHDAARRGRQRGPPARARARPVAHPLAAARARARRAGGTGRLGRGLRPLEASIARDDAGIYVAYRDGARRLVLATAGRARRAAGRTGGCACAGRSTARRPWRRIGLRTIVATSQRVRRRYRIFLTAVGPAGAFVDRLTRTGGSDLAPLAATGPDGRVYVGWTHRPAVARAAPRCCAECSEAAVGGGRFGPYDRTPARLLRAPARRGRPRGRRGHRPRARSPAEHAGDDRLRELRPPGRPRVPGQRADQQVRRGLPGQALLRRLRVRRHHRAARDRPREGALRRRPRQRPAARRRPGQHRRLPRAAAARATRSSASRCPTAATSATA